MNIVEQVILQIIFLITYLDKLVYYYNLKYKNHAWLNIKYFQTLKGAT